MKTISKLFIGSLLGIFLLLQTLSATAAPLATPDDTTWYIPLAFKDFHSWNTKIWIFNKSISVATFDIRWIPGGGGGCPVSWPNQVAPYSWVIVEPVSFCPGVASVYIRGWKQDLTGNVPIVVYSLNYAPNGATFSTQESYAIPSSQLRNWAALPLVTQNADWTTGVSIQNAGSITDSFTLHNATGGCSDGPYSIAPNASVNIVPSCHGTGVFNESYVTNASNANNVAVFVSTAGPNGNTFGYASALGEQFSSSIDNRISSNTAWWYGTYTIVHCKNTNGIAGTITLSGGTSNSISLPAWGVARFDGGASGNPATFTTVSIDSGALMFCIVNGVYMNEYNAGLDGEWAYTVTDNVLPKMSPHQGQVLCGAVCNNTNGIADREAHQQTWYYNYGPTIGGVGDAQGTSEFIPMYSGNGSTPPPSPSSYVAGANEPNNTAVSGGSAICPENYLATWRAIEIAYGNRKLASPGLSWGGNMAGCADGDYQSGLTWLANFRSRYLSAYGFYPHFDVLVGHCYFYSADTCANTIVNQGYVATADSLGIPEVWITEFNSSNECIYTAGYSCRGGGVGIDQCPTSDSCERTFLEKLALFPKVTRYAWFTDNNACGYNDAGLSAALDCAGSPNYSGILFWTYR